MDWWDTLCADIHYPPSRLQASRLIMDWWDTLCADPVNYITHPPGYTRADWLWIDEIHSVLIYITHPPGYTRAHWLWIDEIHSVLTLLITLPTHPPGYKRADWLWIDEIQKKLTCNYITHPPGYTRADWIMDWWDTLCAHPVNYI